MNTIVVIPARGGSKGIPRKNLRPMAGKPLIYYSIKAALGASNVDKVVVTTDDDEIALFAERFGATVIMRDNNLANDVATLDPVIKDAAKRVAGTWDIIVTVQPTSPLILSADIETAINQLIKEKSDTVISVVDDRHLCWTKKNKEIVPEYSKRVNRQQLPTRYKETGAVVACTNKTIETGSRIGHKISLYEMPEERSHDIDTMSDFFLCESLLSRKKIIFNIAGNSKIGLGHAFRSVMLAHDLVKYDIIFVVGESHKLAGDYIKKFNYTVIEVPDGMVASKIKEFNPDIIINDILDTTDVFIRELKEFGAKVVNFEDLGSGIDEADLVINALYTTILPHEHVVCGSSYFCLRDEFLHLPVQLDRSNVKNVLICFGGVDEGNLTLRTLNSIYDRCKEESITITIVIGPGYMYGEILKIRISEFPSNNITLVDSTPRISDYMISADLAFTSGGRTVFELAAVKVPAISICQNERELTHLFASSENGVVNLGHRDRVTDKEITSTFIEIIKNKRTRELMLEKSQQINLSEGKERVISLIKNILSKDVEK